MDTSPAFLHQIPLVSTPLAENAFFFTTDFFREGNVACKNNEKQLIIDNDDEELLHNPFCEVQCKLNGCPYTFKTVHDYEMHYKIAHIIVCIVCKKSFPSHNLLDLHLDEFHRYDNYSPVNFSCLVTSCKESFSSGEQRKEHCIKVHMYPADFKFMPVKSHKTVEKDEKMEVTDAVEFPNEPSKKVPRTICFGREAVRMFAVRHKIKKPSTPSDITMKEISQALDDSCL